MVFLIILFVVWGRGRQGGAAVELGVLVVLTVRWQIEMY